MKNKKRMIILLSVVLVLVIVLGAALLPGILRRASYDASVFGKKYVIQSCVYEGYYTYYEPEHVYSLSDDGRLQESSDGKNAIETISDAMVAVELTEENFDKLFLGDLWKSESINARYVRENTEKAWYAIGNNGVVYYVVLQKNGDVFLCKGAGSRNWLGKLEVTEIGEILSLKKLG